MHALVLDKYGPPENFTYREVPKPSIKKPKQVLIKVSAAACNAAEILMGSGKMKAFVPLKFPAILGLDYSGIIEEIGSKVTNLQVGQEVHGQFKSVTMQGTFAEYIVVEQDVDVIVPKPAVLSHAEAASLGTAGATAYEGIVNYCKIKQGDRKRVLVIGAAGGVGSYAVAIAKALGVHVTGICSTGNVEVVKQLGADVVIDYKSETFVADLKSCQPFDCVMDTVGGDNYYFLVEPLIKKGGIYTSAVVGPVAHGFGDKFSISLLIKSLIKMKWRDLVGRTRCYIIISQDVNQTEFYRTIDNWFIEAKIKSPQVESISLKDGATALSKLEKHKISGKVALIP